MATAAVGLVGPRRTLIASSETALTNVVVVGITPHFLHSLAKSCVKMCKI